MLNCEEDMYALHFIFTPHLNMLLEVFVNSCKSQIGYSKKPLSFSVMDKGFDGRRQR